MECWKQAGKFQLCCVELMTKAMLQGQTLVMIRIWEFVSKYSCTIFLSVGVLSRKNSLNGICWKTPGAVNTPATFLPLATLHSSPRTAVWMLLQDTTCPPVALDLCRTLNKSMCTKEEWLCWWWILCDLGGGLLIRVHPPLFTLPGLASQGHVSCSRFMLGWVNCGLTALVASLLSICSSVLWLISSSLHPARHKPIFTHTIQIVKPLGH